MSVEAPEAPGLTGGLSLPELRVPAVMAPSTESRAPEVAVRDDAVTVTSNSWGGTAALLTLATVGVSLGNYVYSFLVVHLMSARDFSRFSGAQGLMLVLGSGCMAAIPWAMARYIAERKDRRARQEAIHFGLIASALQGLAFAAVAGVILWREAGPAVGAMVAISAFVGSLIAVPVGFLQGLDRMRAITAIRILEFVVRFVSGILILLLVSRSAAAALIGYPIGAAVLIAAGLRLCRSGLPPRGGEGDTIRALVRQSGNLGAIQVFLSMLGALDTVAVLAAHLGTDSTASYQSAALLGRIPLFLSASIGLAAYVRVVKAKTDGEVRERMGEAARLYSIVVIPFAIVCLTVPDSLMHLLIPARYSDATALLRFTVVSGAAVGWIDIVSTAHQARARFRPALWILGVAAVAQPIVLIVAGRTAGIWVFAAALVAVSLTGAVLLSADARAWLPARPSMRALGLMAATIAAGFLLRGFAPAWIALVLAMGVVALRALQTEMQRTSVGNGTEHESNEGESMDVESELEVAPEPPRIVIIGDSWAAGLGVRGESFGKLAAAELGAEHVLDLAEISKTVGDTLADAERIRAFAPDLAIMFCGGTDSLVLPGPRIQGFIERWGPRSWRGVAGLQPRATFSQDPAKRRRQRIASNLRLLAKHIALRFDGRRRVPLQEYRRDLPQLIEILEGIECAMTFVSMPWVDERLHPGSPAALADTQTVLEATLQGHSGAVLIDVHDVLDRWGDFLYDHMHLNRNGNHKVAELVIEASRPLLAARQTNTAKTVV